MYLYIAYIKSCPYRLPVVVGGDAVLAVSLLLRERDEERGVCGRVRETPRERMLAGVWRPDRAIAGSQVLQYSQKIDVDRGDTSLCTRTTQHCAHSCHPAK